MPIRRCRFLAGSAAALVGAAARPLEAQETTMTPQPFAIDTPQAALDDLARRLAATRFPDQVAGADWEYGTDTDYLRELVAYWREGFDWRAQQARLNGFPQFTVAIASERVHFLHLPSSRPDAVPLMLLHGWPSSFVQMLEIAPLLTDPASGVAFDLVVPSLIGYGFSSIPTDPGMSVAAMAPIMHRLMTEALGYPRYGLRASDLGAGVATAMALAHPEAVIGLHTGGTNPWVQQVPADLSPAEARFVADARAWNQQEMAYAMLHATRPQTLAAALTDSPAGLAAWIVEKMRRWSDSGGDLESRFSKDEILTNVTIYWLTGTIGASMRLYYETMRNPGPWGAPAVPVAMLMSPKDMFPTPREWAERAGPMRAGPRSTAAVTSSSGRSRSWSPRTCAPSSADPAPRSSPKLIYQLLDVASPPAVASPWRKSADGTRGRRAGPSGDRCVA